MTKQLTVSQLMHHTTPIKTTLPLVDFEIKLPGDFGRAISIKEANNGVYLVIKGLEEYYAEPPTPYKSAMFMFDGHKNRFIFHSEEMVDSLYEIEYFTIEQLNTYKNLWNGVALPEIIETLSITQYADKRKISRSAVLKAIRKHHKLPGVTSFKRLGTMYQLSVNMVTLENYLTENKQVTE